METEIEDVQTYFSEKHIWKIPPGLLKHSNIHDFVPERIEFTALDVERDWIQFGLMTVNDDGFCKYLNKVFSQLL